MLNYFERLARARVAVIGDLMLDCYISGDVSRISPEAPVPVMRVLSEHTTPGGAANVAANLAVLGVGVEVVGLSGLDHARDELLATLKTHGHVVTRGVVGSADRRTTRKLRIIGGRQQMVRVDHEDGPSIEASTEARLIEAALAAVGAADVVVLSDYGKGACSDRLLQSVIDHCRNLGKPLLVDPKRRDFSAYRGATLLTPNRRELTEATGLPCDSDEEAALAVVKAQEACGADILLTRSERGMSYFAVGSAPVHMATVAQAVFDVSGAGDTVVAVLAASMAAEIAFLEGMRLANHAAGVVIAKIGTACVTREELAAAVMSDQFTDVADGKLVDWDTATALRRAWEGGKLTVGFTNGCFDLLHPGHVSLIKQAAASCDRLIVALNTDESVRRLKGPTRPIQNEAARATVIGAIKGVAAVVLFDQETPLELIQRLQPDLLVKGADYTEDRVVGADVVKARGGRVLLAELQDGHSTTKLIERT